MRARGLDLRAALVDLVTAALPDEIRDVARRGRPGHGGAGEKALERDAKALRRREPGLPILVERAKDDALELERIARTKLRRCGRHALEHGAHALDVGRSVEGLPPGRHLVEHGAEREHVGTAIHLGLCAELLRAHVGELALRLTGRGRVLLAARLGDPEVGDLHGAVDGEQDVLRGHVAMHDLERRSVVVGRVVRGVEAGASIHDDPRRQREIERLLPAAT